MIRNYSYYIPTSKVSTEIYEQSYIQRSIEELVTKLEHHCTVFTTWWKKYITKEPNLNSNRTLTHVCHHKQWKFKSSLRSTAADLMRLWLALFEVYSSSSINGSLFIRFFFTKSESRSADKLSRVRWSQYPQMALLLSNLRARRGYFCHFFL